MSAVFGWWLYVAAAVLLFTLPGMAAWVAFFLVGSLAMALVLGDR